MEPTSIKRSGAARPETLTSKHERSPVSRDVLQLVCDIAAESDDDDYAGVASR